MLRRRRRSLEAAPRGRRDPAFASKNAELAREVARLRSALARSLRERNETDRELLKARSAAVPATRVDVATQTDELSPAEPSRKRQRRVAAPEAGALEEPSRKTKMRACR